MIEVRISKNELFNCKMPIEDLIVARLEEAGVPTAGGLHPFVATGTIEHHSDLLNEFEVYTWRE
jgi:hypothetical protein